MLTPLHNKPTPTSQGGLDSEDPAPSGLARPQPDVESARKLVEARHSPATQRCYESDWRSFREWCQQNNTPFLPASGATVVLYIDAMMRRGHAYSTIIRAISTISVKHRDASLTLPRHYPEVRAALQGLGRELGKEPKNAKTPVTADVLKKLLETQSATTLLGIRNRALLLVGYATAARRSWLAQLRLEELTTLPDGSIEISSTRRTKNNPDGKTEVTRLGLGASPDTCPVRALKTWIERAGLSGSGPVFRHLSPDRKVATARGFSSTGDEVWHLVKQAARKAGLDPAEFGAHSLRSGWVTQAAGNGVSYQDIATVTHHASLDMVRRYDRRRGMQLPGELSKLTGL